MTRHLNTVKAEALESLLQAQEVARPWGESVGWFKQKKGHWGWRGREGGNRGGRVKREGAGRREGEKRGGGRG